MKISVNYILLLFYLFIASIFIFCFNNMISFIIANVFLIVLVVLLLKMDVKNPVILFMGIFIIYQISYPILNSLGIRVFEFVELNQNYYILSWIATISFLLSYGSIKNVKYDVNKLLLNSQNNLLYLIYIVLLIVSIFSSIFIIKNGYNSKYDLANSNNLIISIGNIAYTILITFPLFFLLDKNLKIKKILIIIFNGIILLLGLFTFGERSYIFNYIIVIIIYYFTTHKIKISQILIILVLSIFLLSVSSSFKMFFSSDKYIKNSDRTNNIVINFLNSDFASAGFNFNYLLLNDTKGIMKGKTYIYDILSPFEDFIPKIREFSSTRWYANTFWKTRRTGLGFSIIGEGYINFGLAGIILEMFLLARLIKFFYINSNKNFYYYYIYIGFISLSLYSSRQALGNIISPLFKYYISMAIIVCLLTKLKGKKELKNEKIFRK